MTRTSLQRDVKRILLNEWDPIGIKDASAVADEYDSYAGQIILMLRRGIAIEKLAQYLLEIEVDVLGLPADRERARYVAAKLAALPSAPDGETIS